MSAIFWCATATASQSSAAVAAASAFRIASTSVSPETTKSIAASGSDGVSCATLAMRRRDGRSRSPTSGSSSPWITANRLDLPQPLRPTTPTRAPACSARSTLDSSRRSPRRRAKFLNAIMGVPKRADSNCSRSAARIARAGVVPPLDDGSAFGRKIYDGGYVNDIFRAHTIIAQVGLRKNPGKTVAIGAESASDFARPEAFAMQDMTQGPIAGHLVRMSAPIAIGMLFQTLYVLVDLYFVAQLGDAAIAGVSTAGNLQFIVMAATQVLAVGTMALIAQASGRKDQADANLVFNQSLMLALIAGIVTLIGGYLLIPIYMNGFG